MYLRFTQLYYIKMAFVIIISILTLFLIGTTNGKPSFSSRISKDMYCYTCADVQNNKDCNTTSICDPNHTHCLTRIFTQGDLVSIEKRCANKKTCHGMAQKNAEDCEVLGGQTTDCSYCCSTPGCNQDSLDLLLEEKEEEDKEEESKSSNNPAPKSNNNKSGNKSKAKANSKAKTSSKGNSSKAKNNSKKNSGASKNSKNSSKASKNSGSKNSGGKSGSQPRTTGRPYVKRTTSIPNRPRTTRGPVAMVTNSPITNKPAVTQSPAQTQAPVTNGPATQSPPQTQAPQTNGPPQTQQPAQTNTDCHCHGGVPCYQAHNNNLPNTNNLANLLIPGFNLDIHISLNGGQPSGMLVQPPQQTSCPCVAKQTTSSPNVATSAPSTKQPATTVTMVTTDQTKKAAVTSSPTSTSAPTTTTEQPTTSTQPPSTSTEPPTTTTPNPTTTREPTTQSTTEMSTKPPHQCYQCNDTVCSAQYLVSCPAGFDYCGNKIIQKTDGSRNFEKSCVSKNQCDTQWWSKTASTPDCFYLNDDPKGYPGAMQSCFFCCVGLGCNQHAIPDIVKLYDPSKIH